MQKKYVITPNRSYYQKELAVQNGICAGIEFLSLLQSVEIFSGLKFPSSLELLISASKNIDEMNLEREGLASLCNLFFKYGLFGGKMLDDFRLKRDWQEELFDKIFYKDAFPLPYRELQELPCPEFLKGAQIHLYGFSFLPRLYLEFFRKLSLELDVSLYLLSPCQSFWEDLCTDRERISMKKHLKKEGASVEEIEELDSYLREHHPLLANLGKVGRKNLEQISSWNDWAEDEYRPANHASCLATIQNNLLDPESECTIEWDSSFQVHGCGSSKLREVQILYQNLLELLEKNEWNPSDVLVMAPEIESYAPYIHFVFSEGVLPYRIFGLPIQENSLFAQGLIDLFALVESRWEKEKILNLFENPLFQEKHLLTKEEVDFFSNWIDKAHVEWGWDDSSRKIHLEKNWKIDSIGSFSDGIQRILHALCSSDSSLKVEWSDTETLHKILRVLRSLKEDITFLEVPQERILSEWQQIFALFSQNYLISSKEEGNQAFQSFLIKLQQASKKFPSDLISFSWLLDELKEEFREKRFHFHANDLASVTFASYSDKYLSPHKLISLMGMDEESFPHRELPSPFDKLRQNRNVDYSPTRGEKDRYLFLETFLCAKECLLISYCHLSPQDGQKQDSSPALKDLYSYFERGFDKKYSEMVHPPLSFDKSYFQKEGNPFPFHLFQAAKKHYQASKSYSLLSSFEQPSTFELKDEVVTLESLRHLLKDPIGFYCKEVLQIKLNQNEERDLFTLSALDRYHFRKEVLIDSFENIWERLMKERPLPSPFKDREKVRLQKEIVSIQNLGIDEIFSIHCVESEGEHCYPPVKLDGVKVIGSIPDVCTKGLIRNSDAKFPKQISLWADLVVYSLLNLSSPRSVFFLKEKKKVERTFSIPNPKASLEKLVQYYLFAKEHLSPFRWVEEIQKGEKELEKAMRKDFSSRKMMNSHQFWLACHSKIPQTDEVFQKWKDYTDDLIQTFEGVFS